MYIDATLRWSECEHEGVTRVVGGAPSLESLALVQLGQAFAGQHGPCRFPSLKNLSLFRLTGDGSYAQCGDIVAPSPNTLVPADT
jgi:hypothetical protein